LHAPDILDRTAVLQPSRQIGRMWRRHFAGHWWLGWYGEQEGRELPIEWRKIVIV